MKISVFGLGYVGCVSAACLAQDGHSVIGVDVNPHKVATIMAGRSPIIEPGLEEMIANGVATERLCATGDSYQAILNSSVSLICVGTPSNDNGSLRLDYVRNVCSEIGAALAQKSDYHTVVVRSTVLPSTVRQELLPILEQASGKRAGPDFGLVMNPEFLRESSAIADYYSPSVIVIGEFDERSGQIVAELYAPLQAKTVRLSLEAAEMVKYVNNAFHALKICFANEVGNLSKLHDVDGRQIMEVLCADDRLNISPAYLRPGYAFGGSCLPKDLRAVTYRSKELDLETPLLNSLLVSNETQLQRGIRMVEASGQKKVAVLGLSFKAGTDDVRESPMITLVETLLGRGYHVGVYDETLEISNLVGANKSFLEREIPHIASLMDASLEGLVRNAEVVVVAKNSPEFREVTSIMRDDQVLIDLAGIDENLNGFGGRYDGICW